MKSARMVIVVSDPLRGRIDPYHPLGKNQLSQSISLGSVDLLMHGDLDPDISAEAFWDDDPGLRIKLERTLQGIEAPSVRIAAHLTTCFRTYNENAFQVRFYEEERELQKSTGIADLQVWGFHHENGRSTISTVLGDIARALKRGETGALLEELGIRLDHAFIEASAIDLYEHFTLCRHDVLGLFVSPRVDLELAAERAPTDRASSASLLQEVEEKLPGKLKNAVNRFDAGLKKLREMDPSVPRLIEEQRLAVLEVLNNPPEIADAKTAYRNFDRWLSKLDESCSDLRTRLHR